MACPTSPTKADGGRAYHVYLNSDKSGCVIAMCTMLLQYSPTSDNKKLSEGYNDWKVGA